MATLEQHPRSDRFRQELQTVPPRNVLDAAELKAICRAAGADDVGLVRLSRPELDDQRNDILAAFPQAKSLIALVGKMNREPIRTPVRSISNLEFHETTDHLNAVARTIVRELESRGIAAPESSGWVSDGNVKFPGKAWVVSHKPVAVAAGLGRMGIHRNVIHPRFGNFILLDTILLAHDISDEDRPIDYNPCLTCKLCVAACPVGAISPDGAFNFNACMTHNYREFMSGFTDWVSTVADSRDGQEYRRRVSESESASMWQSLAFGRITRRHIVCRFCPAGEEVIGPFLQDRGQFVSSTLKPLQAKTETLYVVPGSDAVEYATRKYPHKTLKYVNGVRPTSIAGFLFGLKLVFQPGASAGLNATYHFTFTGRESATATVVIREQHLSVTTGEHVGDADLRVTADSETWLRFLAKDANIVWAIVRRKVRVKGRFACSRRLVSVFRREPNHLRLSRFVATLEGGTRRVGDSRRKLSQQSDQGSSDALEHTLCQPADFTEFVWIPFGRLVLGANSLQNSFDLLPRGANNSCLANPPEQALHYARRPANPLIKPTCGGQNWTVQSHSGFYPKNLLGIAFKYLGKVPRNLKFYGRCQSLSPSTATLAKHHTNSGSI